jgi:hypothetical protein
MLPSNALHMAAMLNRIGVLRDPTSCTYCSDQSRVISPRSITTTASTAVASTSQP